MRQENIKSDITVIGGGLAGICAAISSARLGNKVALVHNRPVLGGNSSSEIRVWVCGATKHGVNRYARETGIMGELFIENQYQNPDGNPYIWDLILLEKIKSENNIELFLNTDVVEVEMYKNDKSSIKSVIGWMQGSERKITFESEIFIDCTGDGLIGHLAGANYCIGREDKTVYNESLAPEVADKELLGSTILFYTKDAGHEVKFVAPTFAKDITDTSILNNRIIKQGDSGCFYWWIEWGGLLDTAHDNEIIRDELWSVVYGIWDYIKNSGEYDAKNMTLEWVGSIPGKREYRRLMGPYVLNQNDVEEQVLFEDTIGYGGWSIDLHPATGMYTENAGAKHSVPDGVYHIPYRSLYSNNINNLFFAGRNISASHVAFGTIRVMATCAIMGEAAGVAAHIACDKETTPHGIYENHLDLLQQTLLKQDAALLGVKNNDALDKARSANIKVSSYLEKIDTEVDNIEKVKLDKPVGFIVPIDPKLDGIDLLLDVDKETDLTIEIWETGKAQNYIPMNIVTSKTVKVKKCEKAWVSVPVSWNPDKAQNTFVVVRENDFISAYLGEGYYPGVLSFINEEISEMKDKKLHDYTRETPILTWTNQKINRKNYVFKIKNQVSAFSKDKLTNGYVRPYGGPNMWVADVNKDENWCELTWDDAQRINEIRLTFNDDVNEDLINLHHHKTDFEIIPEIIKEYKIQAYIDGQWTTLKEVFENRVRHNVYRLENEIITNSIRVAFSKTNGSKFISLNEIRIY